jgi:hypothetical protein
MKANYLRTHIKPDALDGLLLFVTFTLVTITEVVTEQGIFYEKFFKTKYS